VFCRWRAPKALHFEQGAWQVVGGAVQTAIEIDGSGAGVWTAFGATSCKVSRIVGCFLWCSRLITDRWSASQRLIAFFLLLFALTACGVAPAPLTAKEVASQVAANEELSSEGVEPLDGPLSIEEAVARAMMYNLDHRVLRFEQAMAGAELDLNRFDMLPDVLVSAGYESQSGATPQVANANESNWEKSLDVSWNMTDLGVSYYSARLNADRVNIASANRRRAMHLLISDVEGAFWRTASAQALEPKIAETEQHLEIALERARDARASNVGRPMENLQHLKQLLIAQQNLIELKEVLAGARVELANLVNIPYSAQLLVEPIAMDVSPSKAAKSDIERLELIAIYNNAEIEMGMYELRMVALEARRSIVEILPDVVFDWETRYDTDSFRIYQAWNKGAFAVTSNLIDLFRINYTRKMALTRAELQNMRHAALQMSVVAQVHLSRIQVQNSLKKLIVSQDIAKLDADIEAFMIQGFEAGTKSEDDVVIARVTAAVSLLRHYNALAEYYHAERRLESTLGLEPVFGDIQTTTLDGLTQMVAQARSDWEDGSSLARALDNISSTLAVPNSDEAESAD
jgi:outer membrane protein TolC